MSLGRRVASEPELLATSDPLRARIAWPHPEWWTIALSVAAWLVLVAQPHSIAANLSPLHRQHQSVPTFDPVFPILVSGTWNWCLMVVAMMFPLVLYPVRMTATRSLWRRRHRAIGAFLVGYLSPWLILGFSGFVAAGALGLTTRLHLPIAAAVGFAIAAAWQLTPVKQWALRSCHRTAPLAPGGWRADLDCVGYGWTIGARCVLSCWALMLACTLAAHAVGAMVAVSAVSLAERYTRRPDHRCLAGLLCGLAFLYGAVALS